MANLRLILTGIEALVPADYDNKTAEFSFPLSVLLPNGQRARPAETPNTKGSDRVVPAHNAFLQFRVADLASDSPRRPDLTHGEYGVCRVNGEFLSLPRFCRVTGSLPPQKLPESIANFAKVCNHASVASVMLKNPKMIAARLDLPSGKLKSSEHFSEMKPTEWEFEPPMEGATAKTKLKMGRRPCVEWEIPTFDPFEITSKLLNSEQSLAPLRFVNHGSDVEIMLANVPTDSLLYMQHCSQDIDSDFELYYLLFQHRGRPVHVPKRVPDTDAGPQGCDCGAALITLTEESDKRKGSRKSARRDKRKTVR